MCIAIYKPAGENLPSHKTLNLCWDNNPDGAGFFVRRNGQYQIYKGFMNFEQFYTKLIAIDIQKHEPAGLHFRIETSGGIRPSNCHPFPVTRDERQLAATETKTDSVVIHNGVIGSGEKHLSDTAVFVRDVLAVLLPILNLNNKKHQKTLQEICSGSRFLIAHKQNTIMLGNWIESNGIFFSNDSYKKLRQIWSTTTYGCSSKSVSKSLFDKSYNYDYDYECPDCSYPITEIDVCCPYCGIEIGWDE